MNLRKAAYITTIDYAIGKSGNVLNWSASKQTGKPLKLGNYWETHTSDL